MRDSCLRNKVHSPLPTHWGWRGGLVHLLNTSQSLICWNSEAVGWPPVSRFQRVTKLWSLILILNLYANNYGEKYWTYRQNETDKIVSQINVCFGWRAFSSNQYYYNYITFHTCQQWVSDSCACSNSNTTFVDTNTGRSENKDIDCVISNTSTLNKKIPLDLLSPDTLIYRSESNVWSCMQSHSIVVQTSMAPSAAAAWVRLTWCFGNKKSGSVFGWLSWLCVRVIWHAVKILPLERED